MNHCNLPIVAFWQAQHKKCISLLVSCFALWRCYSANPAWPRSLCSSGKHCVGGTVPLINSSRLQLKRLLCIPGSGLRRWEALFQKGAFSVCSFASYLSLPSFPHLPCPPFTVFLPTKMACGEILRLKKYHRKLNSNQFLGKVHAKSLQQPKPCGFRGTDFALEGDICLALLL